VTDGRTDSKQSWELGTEPFMWERDNDEDGRRRTHFSFLHIVKFFWSGSPY
jgi:hypothetical protein